ncbi:MAG: hypothetical protein KDA24_28545 [Deltaproteobacteria bacterium]|nr:hypothetical protein [Deltaproteobacteria bacterium]
MTSTQSGEWRALFAGLAALFAMVAAPSPVMAQEEVQLVPVVSGKPAGPDADVVVLCPDLGLRPEVFLSRGTGGLATRLAASGYRVYLVDPWNTSMASDDGFDGVVAEAFPQILGKVKTVAGAARVTFVGHGLCGLLPVAAAADPRGTSLQYRWVGLGTRFAWHVAAPRWTQWLQAFVDGERPLPAVAKSVLLTGFRPGVGARASSIPASLPQEEDIDEAMYRFYDRSLYREPPAGVIRDLFRWMQTGAMTSRQGWVDYGRGLDVVQGPALLVAGMSDSVAPPEDVLAGVDRLRARISVDHRLLSRANGHREEYGHLGMLISRHAARDVDRLLLAWLADRELP